MRMGDWIQTYTGHQFWPLDPQPGDFLIEDIAHALSNICRFTGHCMDFYSVAQHSVHVSLLCKPQDALAGLLHDASEAYLSDISRPLKHEAVMAPYRKLEADMEAVIAEAFHLQYPMPLSVKRADEILLATEMRDLMCPPPVPWYLTAKPDPHVIVPWTPSKAKRKFLKRYQELCGAGR